MIYMYTTYKSDWLTDSALLKGGPCEEMVPVGVVVGVRVSE